MNVNSNSRCPACGQEGAYALEVIDLDAQHAHYAPSDQAAREAITREAKARVEKYQMMRCVRCSLEYAHPFIAPTVGWYSLAYSLLNLYPANRWEFDYVLNQVQPGNSILEVGCGSGFFLKKCKAKGVPCHGLDFEPDAVAQCQAEGLSASLMDITDATPEEEQGQISHRSPVIAAFHILEHLDNPGGLFALASRWSPDEATMWIAVPSCFRPTRILKQSDFLDQPPHHMSRWNKESLARIGEANGWKLEQCVYEPISFSAVLWWYSRKPTGSFSAEGAQPAAGSPKGPASKLRRLVTYPIAALKWLLAKDKMTGHTVVAKFRKSKEAHAAAASA